MRMREEKRKEKKNHVRVALGREAPPTLARPVAAASRSAHGGTRADISAEGQRERTKKDTRTEKKNLHLLFFLIFLFALDHLGPLQKDRREREGGSKKRATPVLSRRRSLRLRLDTVVGLDSIGDARAHEKHQHRDRGGHDEMKGQFNR